jgi:signal transduction histidine kinase
MRSLFLRIFLWFWLAMALVVMAYSLSTMMAFNEGPKHLGGQLAMYGLAVTQEYEREGKTGADNYLSLLERTTRTRAYFFDENGTMIAGRDAPPEIKEIVQSLIPGGENKVSQTSRTDFVARKINFQDGKSFIMAGEFPRPPRMFLPFRPGVWWAQLIAVLLTTGVLCYGLARYFSSPIIKLRKATQQVAAGDLSARVGAANDRRRDELADLGRDFDIMAERIQTLMTSQRRLLHDISHELRSPLARLKIALELARQSDGEEAGWALDRIEREADRLNDLIGQLLTLARLEGNSPVTGTESVDVKRLVDEIAIDADFEARSRNRAVNVVTSHDCLVVGNEQLLHSAIENVVRNAVRYTAEGTEVEVSLRCVDDGERAQAVISVLDQGAGVPQAALANIFRPFYRVADARDRQSGGIGLGLSISQRAVEIHGGAIKAINAPGGGLLVEIHLPIGPQQDV